jgi:hypothetical protein
MRRPAEAASPPPPSDPTEGASVIGRESGSGDFASVIASGEAEDPSVIWVEVRASPNQHIAGNWTMDCSGGFGAGSKDGEFEGTTPVLHKLKFCTMPRLFDGA